jgi:hypothetical protein
VNSSKLLLRWELTFANRIGTFYNALPGQNRKDLVEEWAKDHYPDVWSELEKLGQRTMKEGHRLFNMKTLDKA